MKNEARKVLLTVIPRDTSCCSSKRHVDCCLAPGLQKRFEKPTGLKPKWFHSLSCICVLSKLKPWRNSVSLFKPWRKLAIVVGLGDTNTVILSSSVSIAVFVLFLLLGKLMQAVVASKISKERILFHTK